LKVEDYISSGVLELYVLDLLNKAERREVQQMLEKHPEVRDELEKIELAMEGYASSFNEKPNSDLKLKLLNTLEFSDERKPAPVTKIKVLRWFAAAASILFIFSLGLNIYQTKEIRKVESTLADLRSEQNVLANQNQTFKAKLENTEEELGVTKEKIQLFQNPNIQNILIKGSDISPESYAYISYNKVDKSINLSGINLPDEGKNKSYQLWALVDGTPVDLGVFNSKDSLIKVSKAVENAGAFAVTLQDKGGNPSPNLEQLYLIGNV
jgi:anti-sigma-K factor RskA